MNHFTSIRIAVWALTKNKLRAGLTVLGVVIGIAAVTTMVSLGQSASALVQGQFELLGSNVILVFPGNQRRQGVNQSGMPSLTSRDAEAIERDCPSVKAVSPLVGAQGQVVVGNVNYSPRELLGVGESHLTVSNWVIRHGHFFSDREINSADKVCVVGHTIVAKLFQTADPVGQSIRIKNIPFRIIGVLDKKGTNMVGQDQDSIIMMPFTTVRKRLRGSEFDNVDVIFISATTNDAMSEAVEEITQVLSERHRIVAGEPRDFEVGNSAEFANVLGMITGTLTLMLSAIAGISLLVGGVGIMNIMLVSITERTREIGIRMAVGATSWDILRQFLVEAVLLSIIGGMIGFALGVGASVGVTSLINYYTSGTKWPIIVSLSAAVLSFFFSAFVGVVFGFFPAWRASRLDPIDALRYE